MLLIERFRKRRAIKRYARTLPALLVKRYGKRHAYTPAQIRATIQTAGLDPTYACYALAMFAARDGFTAYHLGIGETCDYSAMRAEVATIHFHAVTDFAIADFGLGDASPGGDAWSADAAHGHRSGP